MNFTETDEDQRLTLEDGSYLLLVKRNISVPESGLTWNDYARNIFRVSAQGEILWRIETKNKFIYSSYTNLFVEENQNLIYNSSGFRCLLDLETGISEAHEYPLLGPWKQRPLPPEYPLKSFFERKNEQRVYLDDGTYLFLAERNIGLSRTSLSPEDYSRNVFRMTEDGEVLWRVKTDRDSEGSPFTYLYRDEDPRKMHNWSGYKYIVDLETGEAKEYAYTR